MDRNTGSAAGAKDGFEGMPVFIDRVRDSLPDFMKRIVSFADTPQEADVLCLGALVTLSACIPNVSGLYDGVTVWPNMYFFLSARAGSGKGRLGLCRLLAEPIHKQLFAQYRKDQVKYRKKMAEYNARKAEQAEPPTPPVRRMLFIPANSSATSVYQILSDNGERGLIFETEGDTLAYSFSSDFGNFSDGLRKAFHHEPISYHRRKDDEHVDIASPKLSAVLSGTPGQLQALVRDAENGLFSRFILYKLETKLTWKDVFAGNASNCLNDQFAELGQQYFRFYSTLCKMQHIRFRFNDSQAARFNFHFEVAQSEISMLYGEGMVATVRRLGLITFRIAMVLTSLRMMESGLPESCEIVCSDTDFETAMDIEQILELHATSVFESMCGKVASVGSGQSNAWLRFVEGLPDEFTRAGYAAAARTMGISDRTAQRYINIGVETGVLERYAQGMYRRVRVGL